jgi:hypothetical protein
MRYLLDANVLINAHRDYYPIDRFPEFWDWLEYLAARGVVKIPLEIFEEFEDGGTDEERDLLYAWIQRPGLKEAFVLAEEVDIQLLQAVEAAAYPGLSDVQQEQIGRDPFLVAYALAAPDERCVVTNETSRPGSQPQNRKVPDACNLVGVQSCNTFKMMRDLQFTTGWRNGVA